MFFDPKEESGQGPWRPGSSEAASELEIQAYTQSDTRGTSL